MSTPPKRADARRNRERILRAASEAFAAEGHLVPLDDIACRAGVGAGTVYRNFPTKEALFAAVVTDRVEQIVAEAKALGDAPDPGAAFYGFVTEVVQRAMFNHALSEALAADIGSFDVCGADAQFTAALDVLLERAQAAGAVRADVDVQDVRALMTAAMYMERRHGGNGRLASLAYDGLRPEATKRNETNVARCELCAAPLTPAQTGRPARFCSAACRQKAHRRKRTAPKTG
ncbi:TetR/AcrR family transcriptional regulator [Actinomadura geliboluensis]|uniref:TetR/AcrR family transcriptional regulator n=1 Tax=Actinomadura geliboluensis TaxID=882440 RepID=UPI0037210CAC